MEYTNGFLGRRAAEPPAAAPEAIRVEAEAAVSVTPPLTAQDKCVGVPETEASPQGESIAGFRDFIFPGTSATYRIEIPPDGEYLLGAFCLWPQRAGSFTILVNENDDRDDVLHPSKDGPLDSWTAERMRVPLHLGAGSHTVRIVGRTPGARIGSFELAPAPASR